MSDALFEVARETAPELPDIQGTEAQIPWAVKIRSGKLAALGKVIREGQAYVRDLQRTGKAEAAEKNRAWLRKAIDREEQLRRITSARYWIDHRDNSATELVNDAPARPGGSW